MNRVAKGVTKSVAAIVFGAIIAILAFLLGGAKARTRREDDLRMEEAAANKAARNKVLAADPRDVLAGLDADTRTRIERAETGGIEVGLSAAREALQRRGGAGSSPGGG
jgi:hypothetical protein